MIGTTSDWDCKDHTDREIAARRARPSLDGDTAWNDDYDAWEARALYEEMNGETPDPLDVDGDDTTPDPFDLRNNESDNRAATAGQVFDRPHPRKDIHRPAEIVPADYDHLFSFSYPGAGASYNMGLMQAVRTGKPGREPVWGIDPRTFQFTITGYVEVTSPWGKLPFFEKTTGSQTGCDVCGASFLHGDAFLHRPTGEVVLLGHICADKMDLHVDRGDWTRRQRELVKMQVALVFKIAAESSQTELPEIDPPAGRQTITGKVVSAKYTETGYPKMLVEVTTDEGKFRVWGTMPIVILDRLYNHYNKASDRGYFSMFKGSTVQFTATIKPKEKGFGFYNRPSKAKVTTWSESD